MGGPADETTVLVVDDDDSMRLLCRVNLELEGYRVLDAPSVEAAQELLAAEPVRVVLLDVHVGPDDGRALLRDLRARRPDVAVAFMTGTADVEDLAEAKADGVLGKPFSLTDLTGLVARLAAGTVR
jgi:DNA-binding NtrC family response regulator